MQAHNEGTIGCVKQRSRTSLLHAGKLTRSWDGATKDFGIKRVFLWASQLPREHRLVKNGLFGDRFIEDT